MLVLSRPALHWHFTSSCPPAWEAHLAAAGGGFFHAPAGLGAGAPPGDPIFGTLHTDDSMTPVALVAGVRTRCRYSVGARHVYFPTLPAVLPQSDRDSVLRTLFPALRRLGAAEVQMDSYDADWSPDQSGRVTNRRFEFVLPLNDKADDLVAGGSRTHQRHFRRGERNGWTLQVLYGRRAASAMEGTRADRATRLGPEGAAVHGAPPAAVEAALQPPGRGWGTTVFAAFAGEELLAAALVGWANHRAFYVSGGSTARGYDVGAAVWMHWRIAQLLLASGLRSYNLGGVPSGAIDATHPNHGLFRFKTGFGTDVRDRVSLRCVLGTLHDRLHQTGHWIAAARGWSRAAAT